MQAKLEALKGHLREIKDLEAVTSVLYWDQTTYMPEGGAPARGRQLALIARMAHEKQCDPAIGKLLEALEPWVEELGPDNDDAALIRVARRDYDKAVKMPSDFVEEFNLHTAETYQVWTEARPANDFKRVEPLLEKTLDLSRRMAGFFPGYDHIVDPLIDFRDPGVTVRALRPLFSELKEGLVPLVRAITEGERVDDSCVKQHFPQEQQLAFGREIVTRFGYDFSRGREDISPHPFTTSFSIGDVRITTRVREHDLTEALFGTLHEAGHGMYEQGINPDYEGLPIADGTSSGVHESQSRLWENVVGRSRPFWEYAYPELQQLFPDQLGSVPLDVFYRAINKVSRSLIRTDADEVTYNLHVMLRFELELELLEGALRVKDLPEVWRARFKDMMGIEPPDDKDGVMQDVHWYAGKIGGAFQGYTLGNVLASQFYAAAVEAEPEIPGAIARGEFAPLHTWMKDNIYWHGRKHTAVDLVQRTTGGAMSAEPYLTYLREKYGALYDL